MFLTAIVNTEPPSGRYWKGEPLNGNGRFTVHKNVPLATAALATSLQRPAGLMPVDRACVRTPAAHSPLSPRANLVNKQ